MIALYNYSDFVGKQGCRQEVWGGSSAQIAYPFFYFIYDPVHFIFKTLENMTIQVRVREKCQIIVTIFWGKIPPKVFDWGTPSHAPSPKPT